jgi:exonuclease SbcC
MAFSFKDSKPRLNLNFLTSSKENIESFTSLKQPLESMDLEEEEKHLKLLRLQRNKLENLQVDVKSREGRIKELEDLVDQLQRGLQESSSFRNDLETLTLELKEREENNLSLKKQLKMQVQEYEFSLNEIRNAASREVEEKNKEISSLKAKIVEKDKNVEDLNYENSKIKKELNKLANAFEIEKESKVILVDEHSKGWKAVEKLLKQQIMELTHEKLELSEKMQELQEKYEKVKENPEKSEFKLKLLQKEQEIALLKKSSADFQKRTELELTSLQTELQRAVSIVSRQESTIVELRRRKTEDDSLLHNLRNQLNLKDSDVTRTVSIFDNTTKDSQESSEIEVFEQMTRLQSENSSLKSKILELRQKEENLKLERKKVAQLKMDMISQRNAEVIKLSDALSAAITRKC